MYPIQVNPFGVETQTATTGRSGMTLPQKAGVFAIGGAVTAAFLYTTVSNKPSTGWTVGSAIGGGVLGGGGYVLWVLSHMSGPG